MKDIRRAAGAARHHLGWKPTTGLVAGRLFIATSEVPEAVKQLAEKAAVDTMDRAWRDHQ
ncbi:hypothetical protein [Streptomyces sp. NPDC006645]|uniref:hypothetical protein n=1 Tax=unclassified Streptomyces TaxID=2593676 RepID=UPI0033AA9F4A